MEPQVLHHEIDGTGPTLVLVPGGLTGSQTFAPLVPPLSIERRVVRVQPLANARGAAGEVGRAGYTAGLERENLRRTIEAVADGEPVHLLGWSNGGRSCVDLAIHHPELVRSLTAVEPAAWWLVRDRPDAAAFEDFVMGLFGQELTEADLIRFLADAGVGPADSDVTRLPGWPVWWACRNSMSWFDDTFLAGAEAGLHDVESIAAPVLLARGTTTAAWLRAVVDVLAARLPQATVLDLEGGHACLLQDAATFVPALESHLGAAERT
jgi:pimeloyl-ACP methyl ester carboxylesterase